MVFDPFAGHRQTPPEPVQAQPVVKVVEIDPKSTADAPAIEACPPSKPVETARTSRSFNPFDRHASKWERRPRPVRPQVPPAQRLMTWLPRWPKATISVRDVRLFGPNSLRDPEIASDAVEILAGFGWLIPVETRRRDMKWWQIVRGRGEDETVATPSVAQL